MMLNGLQTSSKTIPLDTVSAKFQSVDAETNESVSFGSLLKLKEKQLQHDQDANASVGAAAFIALQISSFGTSFPITKTEVIEVAAEPDDSSIAVKRSSEPTTSPIETSNLFSVSQVQVTLPRTTEPTPPTFRVDIDSINESISQHALVEVDIPGTLSQTSHANEANHTAEVEKGFPSLPPQNMEFSSVDVATTPTEQFPVIAVENQVLSKTITMNASPPATKTVTTANPLSEREVVKTNTDSIPQTTRNLEVSEELSMANPVAPHIKTWDATALPAARGSVTTIGPKEEDKSKTKPSVPTAMNSMESVTTPVQNSTIQVNLDQETSGLASPLLETSNKTGFNQIDLPASKAPASPLSTGGKDAVLINEISSDHSEYHQSDIAESVHDYQTAAQDSKTDFQPAFVNNYKQELTQSSSRRIFIDNSTDRQAAAPVIGKQYGQPASTLSHFYSSPPDGNAKTILFVENQLQDGTLALHDTVNQSVAPGNNLPGSSPDLSSPAEIEVLAEDSSEQGLELRVLPQQSAGPAVKAPGKGSFVLEGGFSNTLSDHAVQSIFVESAGNSSATKVVFDHEVRTTVDRLELKSPSSVSKSNGEGKASEKVAAYGITDDNAVKLAHEGLHLSGVQDDKTVHFGSSTTVKSELPQPAFDSTSSKSDQNSGDSLARSTSSQQVPVDPKELLRNSDNNLPLDITKAAVDLTFEPPALFKVDLPVPSSSHQTPMVQNTVDRSTEKDVPETNKDIKSTIEVKPTGTKRPSTVGIKEMDLFQSDVQEAHPDHQAISTEPFETVVFGSKDVVTGTSSTGTFSNQYSDVIGNANSGFAGETFEPKASSLPVVGKISVSTEDDFKTRADVSQVQTRQGKVDAPRAADKRPEPDSSASRMNLVSSRPGLTSGESRTRMDVSPEAEVAAGPIAISKFPEDFSQELPTGFGEKTTIAFGTVDRQADISTARVALPENRSKVSADEMSLPAVPVINKNAEGTSLQAFSVLETLDQVVVMGDKFYAQSSQPKMEDVGTKSSEKLPVSKTFNAIVFERGDVEIVEAPDAGIGINTGKFAQEIKLEPKYPKSETVVGNNAAELKTVEEATTFAFDSKIDLHETEHILIQDKSIETGDVVVKTTPPVSDKLESTATGSTGSRSNTFAEEENILQVGTEIPVTSYLSEKSNGEHPETRAAQSGNMVETRHQVVDGTESQSSMRKAVESENDAVLVDQSAPIVTGLTQDTKGKSNFEQELKDTNIPVEKSKGSIRTQHFARMIESGPGSIPALAVAEFEGDQNTPVPFRLGGAEESERTKHSTRDEKVSPVEHELTMKQMSGLAVPANGPVDEPLAANPGENISSNQLHADVMEVVQRMIQRLNPNLKSRPVSMRLQLNPRELGAIDIQLVSNTQGVQVTFFAEQASTGKLLETQLDQLRVSLVDSGVHLSGLNIGQHGQSGQKGGSFEQSPNFAQDGSHNFPKAQTGIQKNPGLKRSIGQSTEIDYLI